MEYCLNEVRRSYALVLILSSTLTDHTRQEYEFARAQDKPTFVFFKKGRQRGNSIAFRKNLRSSWRVFQNTTELESMLYKSLRNYVCDALREFKSTISTDIVEYQGPEL